MANINITSDAWTEISITSGTIQNISATADIELSAEQTDNSGVVLKPSEIYQWDNETIYARAVTEDTGALRVVNFKKAAGGGGGYVLPVASASTLGGIKVGNNLSIDASGVLSATGGGGGYVLPPATASTLGGVIIGDNVTVDANGEISVAAPYSLPKAAAGTLGGVKIGSNVNVDSDGVISVAAPYSLPTAAANTLGGIKVGSGLSIDASGVLSAVADGFDPVGRVVFDVILRTGYIKANGATVADASTAVPGLLQFVQNNPSLLAANQSAYDANVGLYLYDSGTDALTLPDYTGRFMQGGNSVESVAAGLPNIKGTTYIAMGEVSRIWTDSASGAFSAASSSQSVMERYSITPTYYTKPAGLTFNAYNSSSIYSDSVTTVQPPAIKMIPQIKY